MLHKQQTLKLAFSKITCYRTIFFSIVQYLIFQIFHMFHQYCATIYSLWDFQITVIFPTREFDYYLLTNQNTINQIQVSRMRAVGFIMS